MSVRASVCQCLQDSCNIKVTGTVEIQVSLICVTCIVLWPCFHGHCYCDTL